MLANKKHIKASRFVRVSFSPCKRVLIGVCHFPNIYKSLLLCYLYKSISCSRVILARVVRIPAVIYHKIKITSNDYIFSGELVKLLSNMAKECGSVLIRTIKIN